MNEQFSAFLDNEATRDESDAVVNALLRDDKLRASWTRQHWIREALRGAAGDPPVSLDAGFAGRVMLAARDEVVSDDTVAGGAALDWQPNRHASTTHSAVVAMPHPGQRRRRWRNMAGLAVAASAAGFALLATQPLQEMGMPVQVADGTAQPTRVASADVVAAGFDTDPAATDVGGFGNFDTPWNMFSDTMQNVAARVTEPEASADHWAVSDPTLASRLNGYLVEHNGLARGYGLSVTSPGFVRVATYGASN